VLVSWLACLGLPAGPASAESRCSLQEGESAHELDIEGVRRSYTVRVGPQAASAKSAPLVFLWHGYGSSARDIAPALDPRRFWKRAIVATPEGLPRTFPGFRPVPLPGWQIAKGEHDDRDLAFFDALVRDVKRRYCVDGQRIYSTGFSNGGFFSNLLGCHRADVLAAIAPFSGGGPTPASCGRAIPVRVTHGRRDDVIAYRRGVESLRIWSEVASCDERIEPDGSRCARSKGCAVEVEMCAFDGSHSWPMRDMPALVEFFERHTLGP